MCLWSLARFHASLNAVWPMIITQPRSGRSKLFFLPHTFNINLTSKLLEMAHYFAGFRTRFISELDSIGWVMILLIIRWMGILDNLCFRAHLEDFFVCQWFWIWIDYFNIINESGLIFEEGIISLWIWRLLGHTIFTFFHFYSFIMPVQRISETSLKGIALLEILLDWSNIDLIEGILYILLRLCIHFWNIPSYQLADLII